MQEHERIVAVANFKSATSLLPARYPPGVEHKRTIAVAFIFMSFSYIHGADNLITVLKSHNRCE